MAVLLVDGFDLYNGTGANTGLQAKWTPGTGGTTGASMVSGRFGGQALQVAAGNALRTWERTFTAQSSFAVGFAFRSVPGPTDPFFILAFYSGTTTMLALNVSTTGVLTALRLNSIASSATLGTSAAGVILSNTWHYIEVEITVDDTAGVFKVYVDGTNVINATSVDTRNGTPTTCDTIKFGVNAGASTSGTYSWDDAYVASGATKLGERKVETVYPTSDVAQGFARSSGSTNYTLVDEAQVNGDTDYVQGSTVGDVDTYGLGDLSNTPTTIDAVQVNAFALKTDAGSRSIALQVKSGATTSDGSNYSLNASYGKFERLLTTDPDTSAAWTASGVNALQGGPKVTV